MALPKTRINGLSGLNPLAYVGVESSSPANVQIHTSPPTANDVYGHLIGEIWMVDTVNINNVQLLQAWILLGFSGSGAGFTANWSQIAPGSAGAPTLFGADTMPAGPAVAFLGQIDIKGDPNTANIVTEVDEVNFPNGNTITIRIVDDPEFVGPLTISSLGGIASGVVYTDAGGALTASVAGIAGTVLTSTGPNLAPTWVAAAGALTINTAGGNATAVNNAINFTSTGLTVAFTGAGNSINFEVVGGGVASLRIHPDAGANIAPVADAVIAAGAANAGGVANINTSNGGGGGNVLNIALNESIALQATTADASMGMYKLGGNPFMHGLGTHNTWLGQSAGNLAMTVANALDNTGLGNASMSALTTGAKCTGVGSQALSGLTTAEESTGIGYNAAHQLTTGWWNTILGSNAGSQLLTGSSNCIFGASAGINYVGAESNNIIISHAGVAAETNVIRIGTQGAGDGQQQDAYIAGVYAPNTAIGAATNVVFIDSAGKLGGQDGTGSTGLDGSFIIGATGGAPKWARLTAAGGATITNTPNGICITAGIGAGGGITQVHTDAGTAAENIGDTSVTIHAPAPLTSSAAANTATIALTNGANGQLLIGGGAAATWANITPGANITITNAANSITISATGGAGGGATTFNTDTVPATITIGGAISFKAGTNTNTDGATANTVKINLNDSIHLPDTNVAGTSGVIYLNDVSFLHGLTTGAIKSNAFLGIDAGGAYAVTTGTDDIGIGFQALQNVTSGISNVAVGSQSLQTLNSGSHNTSLGYHSMGSASSSSYNTALGDTTLNNITTGTNNTVVGYGSGGSLTAADSSNILIGNIGQAGLNNTIRIGTQGIGAGQQNVTYIAGIYNTAVGATADIVLSDSTGKLGGLAGVAGQGLMGGVKPSWTGSPSYSGTVTAGTGFVATTGNIIATAGNITASAGLVTGDTGLTATTGNVTVTAGNIALPYCTAIGQTRGVITIDGSRAFWSPVASTIYVGVDAGPLNVAAGQTGNTGIGSGTLGVGQGTTNNTAVGYNALHVANNYGSNVAVGALALDAATGPINNVSVGYDSLGNLLTGTYDTAIGSGSGSAYTGVESNNVLINDTGVVGESNVIRIGNNPPSGTPETATYIGGIYSHAITGTNKPVYIDSTGRLGYGTSGGGGGVAGSLSFAFYQTANVPAVVGSDAGSTYFLGTLSALSSVAPGYNNSAGAFYAGSGAGAAASFTAPATGVYQFTVGATLNNLSAAGTPFSSCWQGAVSIVVTGTSAGTYNAVDSFTPYYTTGWITNQDQKTYSITQNVYMTAGDIAKFSAYSITDTGSATVFFGIGPIVANPLTSHCTYVTGFRIV